MTYEHSETDSIRSLNIVSWPCEININILYI